MINHTDVVLFASYLSLFNVHVRQRTTKSTGPTGNNVKFKMFNLKENNFITNFQPPCIQ